MNLFTVGVTKDGRKQITFGNSPEAIQLLQPIMQGLYAISLGITPEEAISSKRLSQPQDTTTSVRAVKRGHGQDNVVKLTLNKPASNPSVTSQVIKYDYDRESLTPEQRSHDDQRLEIGGYVEDYCEEFYGADSDKRILPTYTKLYKLFGATHGYYPSKGSAMPYLNCYAKTKLNTLILDGWGKEFASFVNREIRRLKGRSTRN